MESVEQLKKEIEALKAKLHNEAPHKATLSFDLNDEYSAACFRRSVKATDAFLALYDVAQEVFRPARKYGYSDTAISKAIEDCGVSIDEEGFSEYDNGAELISLLESKFYGILEERGIKLDEDLY